MKKTNFAVRFGILALLTMSVSSAFAGNSRIGTFPPPEVEDYPAYLNIGTFPPPEVEDYPAYLNIGTFPPPEVEDYPFSIR